MSSRSNEGGRQLVGARECAMTEPQVTATRSRPSEHRLTVPAQSWSLGEIRDFCAGILATHHVDSRISRQVILAIDEAAANIVEHAYLPGESKEIAIKITISERHVGVEFRDTGAMFNPVLMTPREPKNQMSRRGYGLRLISTIMDEVEYQRSEREENVFTLKKLLGNT